MTGSKPFVFYSNRIEVLLEFFKASLKVYRDQGNFFQRCLTVVPSQAVRKWVTQNVCEDSQLEVTAGIQFSYLHQAFDSVLSPFHSHIPLEQELALRIEWELSEIMRRWDLLSPARRKLWCSLHRMLNRSTSVTQIQQLSTQLAKLFEQYPLYGQKELEAWKIEIPSVWEQELWQTIYCGEKHWSLPYEHWRCDEKLSSTLEMHVFAFSQFSPLYHNILCKLSHKIPVYLYMLSPCQVYWADLKSDKERRNIQKFLKEKKVGDLELLELDDYLRERHPLLANFGRLGRECHKMLEELEPETYQHYQEPKVDHLLGSLQSGILHLTQSDEKIGVQEIDRSVEIHVSSSKVREVEILKDQILQRLESNPDLTLEDFVVMAPDIQPYVPYIQTIFQHVEPFFEIQMVDLKLESYGILTQGFLKVLSLIHSRWEAPLILEILEHPCFQRKWGLSLEDVYLIRRWIQNCGICWGYDVEHRNQLLKKDLCSSDILDIHPSGTWRFGWKRLLEGMALRFSEDEKGDLEEKGYAPLEGIESSHLEIINKWMLSLDHLEKELLAFSVEQHHPLVHWVELIETLLQNNFLEDSQEYLQVQEKEIFERVFSELRSFGKLLPDQQFPFFSIEKHFLDLLQQHQRGYHESCGHALHFCSLVPMRTIPYKVICLMGMGAEEFPRQEVKTALDLFQKKKTVSFIPSRTDYDRYLFLETLISAREQLMISYHSQPLEKGDVSLPSLVVSELIHYLDEAYQFEGGKKFSEARIYYHPFSSHDSRYFDKKSEIFRSFSSHAYSIAKKNSSNPQRALFCLKEEYQYSQKLPLERPHPVNRVVELSQLKQVLKDPLRLFLKERFEIFLSDFGPEISSDEQFFLSPLEQSILIKKSLWSPLKPLLKSERREGRFPLGALSTLTSQKLYDKNNQQQGRLKTLGVTRGDLFDYELKLGCTSPQQVSENLWHLPALVIESDHKVWQVVGRIENVGKGGIYVPFANETSSWFCEWPTLLVGHLVEGCDVKTLHFLYEGKGKSPMGSLVRPQEQLAQLIDHYNTCLATPFPFLPEWFFPLFEENEEKVSKLIQQIWDPFTPLWKARTIRLAFASSNALHPNSLIQTWSGHLQRQLGGFVDFYKGVSHASV